MSMAEWRSADTARGIRQVELTGGGPQGLQTAPKPWPAEECASISIKHEELLLRPLCSDQQRARRRGDG